MTSTTVSLNQPNDRAVRRPQFTWRNKIFEPFQQVFVNSAFTSASCQSVPGLSCLYLALGGYRCYFVPVMRQAGRCWVDVCHCYIDARTDPRGLQPSTPLKAINLWPPAPFCTVADIRSISVPASAHTHTRARVCTFLTLHSFMQKCNLFISLQGGGVI